MRSGSGPENRGDGEGTDWDNTHRSESARQSDGIRNERFCELTGYEEDEILSQNCRFMQGLETDPERVAEIRDDIDNEESMSTVFPNYRTDGTIFWNHLTIAPVENADGEVNNWVPKGCYRAYRTRAPAEVSRDGVREHPRCTIRD